MAAERMKMKKILFVVNTLGRAGAETALLELLRRLEQYGHQVSLYVIMEQGEMVGQIPSYVRLLDPKFSGESVLTPRGKRIMMKTVCRAFFRNGDFGGKIRYFPKRYFETRQSGRAQMDKALWRVLSDGAMRFDETFDLAVAYIEGASAYYVADHVKADRKCAFIHIDYENAGYTKEMDQNCWASFDRIFAVSEEAKGHFLAVYPEYAKKMGVFPNLLDQDRILNRAAAGGQAARGGAAPIRAADPGSVHGEGQHRGFELGGCHCDFRFSGFGHIGTVSELLLHPDSGDDIDGSNL